MKYKRRINQRLRFLILVNRENGSTSLNHKRSENMIPNSLNVLKRINCTTVENIGFNLINHNTYR